MKKFFRYICLLGLLGLFMTSFGQSYPNKPVKILVGFPPGGATDVIARLLAQGLSDSFGQSFFVENKGGASGTIATGMLAKSEADGHTLILVPSTHSSAPSLYSKLPYESKDLAIISMVASTPYILVVQPDSTANNLKQLIEILKNSPGTYNYASASPGTLQHLAGELFKRTAGVDIVHIPYKGSGALMPDLLAGRIQMMFENVAVLTPHINSQRLKPLAVTSVKRTALLPDIPTVSEAGLSGFEAVGWFSVLAPAGTPLNVINILNQEINKLTADPKFVKKLRDLGADPMVGKPSQAQEFLKSEEAKWGKIIKDSGIKVE